MMLSQNTLSAEMSTNITMDTNYAVFLLWQQIVAKETTWAE